MELTQVQGFVISLLALQIFIKITAWYDGTTIKRNEEKRINYKPNYGARYLYRGAFAILQSWAVFMTIGTPDLYKFAWYVVFQLAWYWSIFDIEVNLFRGKKGFYMGQTAFIDKIFFYWTPKGHDLKIKLAIQSIILWISLGEVLK